MGSSYSSQVFPAPPKSYDKSWRHYIDIPLKSKREDSCSSLSSCSTCSTTTVEKEPTNIAALYFTCSETKKTVIYSHGNATDIGQIANFFYKMSQTLKVNIICYDYIGYGETGGIASENGCIDPIDAVYNYVRFKLQVPPSQIYLYGNSDTISLSKNGSFRCYSCRRL